MKWFRFHTEALDDPKVQRLSPSLFKTWVNILCIAGANDGSLPSIDDLAFKLRLSVQDAEQQISDLVLAGLIDIAPDKRLSPHGWAARQYASDSSTERVRKLRAKTIEVPETKDETVCNGGRNVSETPPEQKQSRLRTESERLSTGDFSFKNFGTVNRGVSPRLRAKAEGLGLPVTELVGRAMAPDVKTPNAFFRHLVVDALQRILPRADKRMLLAALTKDGDQTYGTVCQMILALTP